MKKTFVVLGCPRSGTSMVAGIMRILNVYMGETIKPDKHEDADILWQPLDKIRQTISKRNQNYDIWGFKDPNCAKYLKQIMPLLRNPQFIKVKRDDQKAIASDLKRNPKAVAKFVAHRNAMFNKVYNGIALVYPSIVIQYESAITNPRTTVQRIAEFVGCTSTKQIQKATSFIKPGDYRRIDE